MLELCQGVITSGVPELTVDFEHLGRDLVLRAILRETWHLTRSLTRSTVPWAPTHNAAVKGSAKAQYAMAFNMLLASGVDRHQP